MRSNTTAEAMSTDGTVQSSQKAVAIKSPTIQKDNSKFSLLTKELSDVKVDLEQLQSEMAERKFDAKEVHSRIELAFQGEATQNNEDKGEESSDDDLTDKIPDSVWNELKDATRSLHKTLAAYKAQKK
ncbi:hypothetical protein EDC01DRAFT_781528 [Geopyxis carbonaria]|nr:hypothetical protein EDC01DRAFT_781528 [Geopyxis carbonaria]